MILPLTPWRQEKEVAFEEMGLRAWRWALHPWRRGIEITKEIRYNGHQRPIGHYLSLSLHLRPRLAYDASYYDGEHRALYLGFICVAWGW